MINKVILIGNLGKDPEIRTMSNSKQCASFSVATTENWTDRNTGEKVSKTEWHNVVIFSEGLVKIAQSYLSKGTRVYLEGSLQTRKWTDNNGNDRYTTEVVLNLYNSVLKILSGKNQQDGGSEIGYDQPVENSYSTKSNQKSHSPAPASTISDDLDDDDIPF